MSLKNIAKHHQRVHRERSQPQNRKHLGELEKKKDYKLRANDYQEKRNRLTTLKRKALDRNPDEFYYHMINSRTEDGVHRESVDDQQEEDTPEQKRLMLSQNLRYVQHKCNVERNKIDRLKSSLLGLESAGKLPNKHTFFVDSALEAARFNLAERLKTHPTFLNRTYNRPRLETLGNSIIFDKQEKLQLKVVQRERANQYQQLAKRLARAKQLKVVCEKLTTKKHLAKKTGLKPKRVKKGGSSTAAIYLWPQERQK